ncbi:MAG: hypothetical protein COV38_00950 [Bdellovibrionales bacterium CG11_big_fil_rev_8_21_14_0_20_38_13]|nr:MAG: hypothetical protein COV38_00950 [Bdellovibrionales bacterium CG11_big_fil_rev_8_21_14_0_20_38_13]
MVGLIQKHDIIDKTILQSFNFPTLELARELEPKLRLSYLTYEEGFCEIALKNRAKIVSPEYKRVNWETLKLCKKNSIQVIPFTVNEPKDWQRLFDLGITQIITDYPRKLVDYLARDAQLANP